MILVSDNIEAEWDGLNLNIYGGVENADGETYFKEEV